MRITRKIQLALRALLLKAGEVETSNGKLIWEGEGELTEGAEVFVEREENGEVEVVPAPDGEYATEQYVYVVKDGKVAEIRTIESAPAEPAEEPAPAEDPEMAEEEPQAEPADANDEETEETVEDRLARLEARYAELVEGLEAILNGIAGLESRIEAVEAKVAGLEEPAGDPANDRDEDFSEQKPSRLSYLRK